MTHFKPKNACRLLAAFALLIVLSGSSGFAQEATPATECVAPSLPEGSPTPLDEDGNPVLEGEASPEAAQGEDMSGHEMESDETTADDQTAASAQAGLEKILACINSREFLAAAALMTPSMIEFVTEIGSNPYDVPMSMEGAEPMEIVATGETTIDSSGRIGVQIVYRGLFSGPGAMLSERWYVVEDSGVWKLDSIAMTTAPEGFMPEATLVEVQLVDFAFALSTNEVPAGPVIFRFSNTSYSNQGHVGALLMFNVGLSSEQIIESEELPEDQLTGYFGGIYLEPGSSADLIFESFEPGTYTLGCDVPTPDGVEHWHLGMIAQFDVV